MQQHGSRQAETPAFAFGNNTIIKMEWAFDAQVESTPLTTTGGHTWKAAYRLADYLVREAAL